MKKYLIKDNFARNEFLFVIGTISEFNKYLSKYHEITVGDKPVDGLHVPYLCEKHNETHHFIYIDCKLLTKKKDLHITIAHEVLHYSLHMMRDMLIENIKATTEAYASHHSYIFTKCLEKLKK